MSNTKENERRTDGGGGRDGGGQLQLAVINYRNYNPTSEQLFISAVC